MKPKVRMKDEKSRENFLDIWNDKNGLSPEKKRKLEELELARKMREHVRADDVEKSGRREEVPERKMVSVERKVANLKTSSRISETKTIERQGHSGSLTKRDRVCRKIIEWGILGLIVWSPLPAASVYEWSILVIQLVVFVMMGAYFLMKEKPQNNMLLSRSLKWPKILFLGLFVWLFVQIIPLPNFFIKIFSPSAFSFNELFKPDFSGIAFTSFSLVPTYTFRQALELLTYILLGFLIIKTVTHRRQVTRILYVLIGMGAFQALYGFFELYNKNPRILFYSKKYYLDTVTGTFVNRNHLSGYLEMVIPLAIGIILAKTDFFSLAGLKRKEKILRLSGKGIYVNIFIPLGIVLMALGIIFSKSRSGVFLLIFSFLLFFEFTILYFQREKESQKVIKNFLKVTLLIITFFALYIGIDSVIERFSMDNLLREARPVFWKQTVDIVGDFPLFGTGLGTFAFVYPVYEEVPSSGFLSHAHNDYLEYLSELGIIGFAILLGGILYLLVNSTLRWRERHHPQVKGIALGGIVSIIVMLLHSISDFNLHIPANMLLFSVVLSLTVVMVFYKSRNARNEHTVAGKEKSRTEDDSGKKTYQKEIEEWRKFINKKNKFDFKAILSLVAVVMLGVIAIIIYWNQHLYYRSKTIENADQKMAVLNHANKLHPLNDLVHYELGKAGFSIGARNIENNEVRDFYLQDSVANYEKSLRINPLSPFSHFYLGQVLYYMSYLEPSGPFGEQILQRSDEEYKKAAKLAGYYGEITHEVGKIYLSRWDELSEEEREFTVSFIKKKIADADREQLLDLWHVWEMNVRDYSVMQEILPEQIHVLRLYAKFLGEKSLSANERQRILAEIEFKEFERARQEFKSAENAFMYMRLSEASKHYEACLNILGQLKFYQDLRGGAQIDPLEFVEMQKTSHLKLAKCRLRMERDLNRGEEHLRRYLELEQNVAAVSDLETYLMRWGSLGDKLEDSMDDLRLLFFHMYLYYKENRYREIMRVGSLLQKSFVVIPESEQKLYTEILQIVGDAYQKVDYIYDAEEFYKMALNFEPNNLNILLSMRKNYEHLRDEEGVNTVNEKIKEVLSQEKTSFQDYVIQKGKRFLQTFILDGSPLNISLHFSQINEDITPLITIFFNGRAVWENYLEEDVLSIPLEPIEGRNELVIIPLNTDVTIQGINYE